MTNRSCWTKKLQTAEQELEGATTRTAVNASAKKLQLAKAELKRLQQQAPTRRASGGGARRLPLKDLAGFVYLEPRQLEMFDHPLSDLLPGIIRRALLKEPAQ